MTDTVYKKIIPTIQTKVQFHTRLFDGNHEVVLFPEFREDIQRIKLEVELCTTQVKAI